MRAVSSMRNFQESKRKENHREQDEILYYGGKREERKKFPSMGDPYAVIYIHRHSECVMGVMLHSIGSAA